MENCYNCGEVLEIDFYWIVTYKETGDQLLGVDVDDTDIHDENLEWIEFEVCKNCFAAQ